MSDSELSRPIKVRQLPGEPIFVEANDTERAALAKRFDLASVETLKAEVDLENEGSTVLAKGEMLARFMQPCSVSGEDFEVEVQEPIALRFIDAATTRAARAEDTEDLEIELDADELDEVEYSGDTFDLGEAIAQSLGLAIDPYAEGPGAEAARKSAGITQEGEEEGPLAEMLKGLKND